MNKPRSCAERGTILATSLIVLPVLLVFLLGAFDLGLVLYHKALVRSAATAAVMAAVGEQRHWHFPIPTKFVWIVYPIPVDGKVINTITLPYVDADGSLRGDARRVAELTNPNITVQAATFPPLDLPSPFKWVEVTASIPPPGALSRLVLRQPLTYKACAIAWVRPDYWVHGWWDAKTLEVMFDAGEPKPLYYYRRINCQARGLAEALEAVAWAHYATTGEKVDKGDLTEKAGQAGGLDQEVNFPAKPEETRQKRDCLAAGHSEAECLHPEPETIQCPDSDHSFTVSPQEWDPSSGEGPSEAELIAERCPPPPAKEKESSDDSGSDPEKEGTD